MNMAEFHPYVYFATRYPFSRGQSSLSRICYTASIYLISEGKGVLITQGRRIKTGPGSLVYISPGQPHDWISDSEDPMVHVCCYFDWTYTKRCTETPHVICYHESQFNPKLLGPLFPYAIPEHIIIDKPWIWISLFEQFYTSNEHTNEKTYIRSLIVQQHFQKFIAHFLEYVLKEDQIPDPRIHQLLEELDQDLLNGRQLPLKAYYGNLQISRGYFFNLFKTTTGLSPVQYIQHFKINRAKDDLLFSNLSITEIAEKHYFSSIHYFSKLFHKLTGKTPSEFRDGR